MQWGTPLTDAASRLLLLGAGELGREVAIEAQRLGIEVIAADRYANAPAMALAHRAHVLDMLDGDALRALIAREQPTWVVPEIEAIHTATLVELEREGLRVVPTARAAQLTMDREGIRRLAAEQLGLPVSPYRFVDDVVEYRHAVAELGLPCVVKPLMSSSGKGQSIVHDAEGVEPAWKYAQQGGRAGGGRAIVEAFIRFDCEITLLTVRHAGGTRVCPPIGHLQADGDYRESWQPQALSTRVSDRCERIATTITDELGGAGIFGVELFIADEDVFFSEVSPRPHDTGMVTLISQEPNQFELHVRAILGLPIPAITQRGPSASCAILGSGTGVPRYAGMAEALREPETSLRLFGKPNVAGQRRLGVALARGEDIPTARARARRVAASIDIQFDAGESA
ncbi:MAG: formate-dependent phosphoribosylglycinamide formyltransferase [Lysobacterales bacterium]